MEEKLAEFRKKQASKKPVIDWNNLYTKFASLFSFLTRKCSEKKDKIDEIEQDECKESVFDWKILLIKCLLWLTLFVIFIRIEFGAIYFIISLLYLIWTSMNSHRRRTNQLSAYSVFNKNFEKIQGTFSAEDYDRQLRCGGPNLFSS